MMRSLRWLLLAAIIAAATAQHVSQPHTVVQGVDGAKMTTTTVEYVVDGKKYTKTYNSKDNAPNTMEGLKKEAEELARKKAVAQGLIHENDKTGEFWIVDPNENLDYHLSTDPNGQVYAVPGAEGKTDAKAPAAEAPKAWYDHQSDPKFDPFLNPSLLPIHREHRSLKGLAHNSKHPIVFAESPLYHHLQRHIRRVTHFIKLRHGDAVRILGVIRGPQGASGANTPEFQQMKAQLATEKAQIKILLAQLRRLKVIETRLFPHWAAAEDVCPDEWTFVGFTARDQRVWCNPPGGNSPTPGNPLCKRTAKFPQKYNRQGWSQFCKAPWAAHHGFELPAGVNVVAHEHAPLHLSKSLQKLLGGFEPAAAKKTREHVESAGGYSIPKPVSAHKKATIIHRALANALRHNSPVALANALAHGGPAASKTLTTLSSMLTKQFLTHPNAPPKAVKVAVKAVAAVEKALTAIQTKHEAKLEKLTSKLEETEDPIKRLALQHKIEKERKKIAAITVKKAKAAIQLGVLNNRLINALEKKLSKLPADSPARKKVEASLKKAHKREEKVQAVLEHVKAKQAEAKIAIKKSLRAFVAQKKELEAKQADLEKQVFAAKEPAKRDALLKDLQKVVQKRQEVRVAQRRARKHLARLLKNQKATAKAAVHALKLQLQGAKDPAVREAIKARLVEARRAVRHINKQIRKAAEKAVKRSLAAVQRTKARIAQTVTAIKDLSQAYKDAQDPKRKKELARELTLHFAALKAAKVKLIRKQRAAVKQLKHKAHVLKAQVHELKKQLAHAKTEAQRTRLQERLEEARDRFKAAKHAVHEARKSIRASKKKLRAFMAHTKEKLATAGFKPSLTVKKRFLNVRKIQLKLRLANLKKQLANAKGPARKELRKKISAAKAKLRAVKRKLSAVKEKIALRFNTLSPAEKLRLSKKRLHYLKKKIARLTAKWENATGAERAKLYHKLKAAKHAVAKVKKIIKKVHHFQSTHTVKKAATRTIRKAKATLKKAKRAANHLQKLLHQLRHAKAKGASAEELEKLKERLRHARRRVRSQARHARRLARKLRRVERKASRAIIQGEHKKKKLRSLIDRLNNKLDKAKEGSAEYAKLKARLHKAEKAFDKADARTERAYRILAKTRRTLSKVKKTLHKLTKLVKKTAPKHPHVNLGEHHHAHHKGLPKKFHGPIQKLKKLKKLLKTLDPESPQYHKVKAKMKKLKKHIVTMAKKKIAALKKKLAETPVDSPHYAKLQKKLLKAKKILHKVKKIVKVVKTAVKVYAVIASGGSAASIIALADKKAILKAKLLRIKKALKHTADDSPRYQKLKALLKKTKQKLSVTKHKLAKANQAKRSAVIKNAQHKLAAIGHKQAKLRAKIMRLRNKLHAATGEDRKAILAKLRRAIHKSEILKAKLHKAAKKAVHALKARSKFLKHQIKALKAKLAAAEDPAVRAKLHEKLLKLASKRAKALKKLVKIQKHQLRAERNFHARVVAQLKARRRQLTNASSDAQREHLRSVIENLEAKARKSLHKMVKLSRAAVKSAKKALKALKAQKKALKAVIKHALQNDPERAAKLQARLQKIKASIKKTKHAVQALKPKLAKLAIAHAHRLKTALRTLKAKLLKARLNAATLTGPARLRAQRRADHLASMVHNLSKKAKKAAKKAAKAIKHKLHNIKAKLIALRAQLAAGTGDSAEIIDRIRALKEKKRALKAALHKVHPLPAGAIKVRLRRLNTMLSKIRAQIKRQRALFKLADDGELKDAADSRLRKLRAKAKLLEEKAHRVRRKARKLFLNKIKNLRNRKEELQARLREPNVPYGEQAAINDEIASIDEHLSKAKHRLAKIKAKLARHDKIERSVEKMRENSEKLESEAAAVAHKAERAIEAFNRKLITLRAAPQAERPKAKLQVVFAGKKALRRLEDAKTATHQHLSALRNQRDKLNKVFKTAPISDRDTITSQVKEIEAKIKAVITSELHIASQKKDVKGRLYEVAPPLLSEVLDAKAEKKEKLGRLAERFARRVRVLKAKIRNLYQRLSDIQDPKERAKLQERIVDLKDKKDKYKRKAVVAKLSLRRIIRAIKKINNKMSILKERNQANREKVRELRHKQRETKKKLAAARNGLENAKYGSPEHEALKRKVEKLEARLTRIVVRKNFLKRQVEATHAKLFGALGKKGVVTELGHRIAFQKERKQEFERKHHRLSLKIESLNDELLTLSKDDPKRKELDQKIADLNHKKFNLAHKIEKITLKVERLVHKKLVAAKVAAKASVESKHAAREEKKAVAQEKKAIAKKIAALNAKERALSTKAAKIVKESKILDAFIRQQQLHLSPDALEALRDKQNALNEKKATLHEKLAKVAEKRSATNKHLDAVVAKTASHLSPVQQAAASKQLHLQTRAAELKARIEIKEKAMAFASDAEKLKIKKDIEHLAKKASVADAKLKVANIKVEKAQLVAKKQGLKSQIADLKVELDGASHARAEEIHAEIRKIKSNIADINDKKKELNNALKTAKVELKAIKKVNGPKPAGTPLNVVTHGVVCDADHAYISCESGSIQIQTATYGRMSFEKCYPTSDAVPRNPRDLACHRDIGAKLQAQCYGKRECQIDVIPQALGADLCPHVFKYLDFTYKCVNAGGALPTNAKHN